MKFVAIIPARYSSSRFPGKPLADIKGKTMIRRVYERTSMVFEHCWVATDDARIENEVRSFGGNVAMTSSDHKSGTDRCAEALGIAEKQSGISFDVVVNVQGDEPFISTEQLATVKSLFDDPATQIATLVKAFFRKRRHFFNPNSPKVVISNSGNALYFSRSVIPHLRGVQTSEWQRTHTYYKHIGLYAYRSEVLARITRLPQSVLEKKPNRWNMLRWIENGYDIKVGITNSESVAIDTPEDLQRVLDMLA
ncbi:MAG: 3-deoxy-manno-octulosonate cytidylyltransferase [Alistipes putredinis]|nr:MAG: 3-deoxy-manno-octulosonate cytidylyltransferase [Alistipes putredinis]